MNMKFIVPIVLVLSGCGEENYPPPKSSNIELNKWAWHLMYIESDLGIKKVPPVTAPYSIKFSSDGTFSWIQPTLVSRTADPYVYNGNRAL